MKANEKEFFERVEKLATEFGIELYDFGEAVETGPYMTEGWHEMRFRDSNRLLAHSGATQ